MKKKELYRLAKAQIRSKIKYHFDMIATLGNVTAILKERFKNFFWVGFYYLRDTSLVLGPFQGPPACMKLDLDTGVCAASARDKQTVLVQNVHKFPGHVACDGRSNSEIVVPVFDNKGVLRAVLDVDSENLDDFNEVDRIELEEISAMLQIIF